jgi:hypothetical protein
MARHCLKRKPNKRKRKKERGREREKEREGGRKGGRKEGNLCFLFLSKAFFLFFILRIIIAILFIVFPKKSFWSCSPDMFSGIVQYCSV